MIPFPVPAAIRRLAEHPGLVPLHGGRVSTDLAATLPALRVTLLPGGDSQPWEWRAEFQIEAWAEDELDAGALIAATRSAWPGFRGPVEGGYVSGTGVTVEPYSAADPDSDLSRYIMQGSLLMHEASS